MLKSRLTYIFLAMLCVSLPAEAAIDAFIKLPGVDGEAAADGHKKWIELLSVSNGFTPGSPTGGGASSSLRFTKHIDKASPVLSAFCAAGTSVAGARLEFMQTDPSAVRFFDIRMSNVLVTAVSVQADKSDTEDRPTEEIALNYGKIKWTYTIVRGLSRLPLELRSAGWDFATATAAGSTNAAVFTASGIREDTGNVVVNWQATTDKIYDVYACSNVSGSYALVTQLTATANGPMSYTASISPGAMFYVVEERP